MSDRWQPVIGLEIHAQLATQSKLFSASPTAYGAEPNSQIDEIDLGLPGVLPMPNRQAVRFAIRFGLAIGANVNRRSVFARKNYFYPDLPKGYQISQYEDPIVAGGAIPIALDDGTRRVIAITRAHLEEDAGKSVHGAAARATGLDFNRAGIPLLEIVSEPVLHSPVEAVAYMKAVHELVRWLGICDGNMQEGSFRCDANVSVKPAGDPKLGTRAEIKNVNSFRFVEKAIAYEIERQIRALENGEAIVQETRLYDETRDQTRSLRGKESAHDYRYFPDPDLPALILSEAEIEIERQALTELPWARRERYLSQFKLSPQDAERLTADRALCTYFETLCALLPGQEKLCANWAAGELATALQIKNISIEQSPVAPETLAKLLRHIVAGTLSNKLAKEVFAALWEGQTNVDAIIAQRGINQVSDDAQLGAWVETALAKYPEQAAQCKAGDEKLLAWLVGQVLKASGGKANPQKAKQMVLAKLAGASTLAE